MTRDDFQERYSILLETYVTTPQEKYLSSAAELGREMITSEIPLEEISEFHEVALGNLALKIPDLKWTQVAHLASAPLMEVLMSYGLAFRERAENLKRTQDELRDNEQKLRNILECLPLPIYVIGPDHNTIYWNRAMAELSGITADEAMGQEKPWNYFYGAGGTSLADILVEEPPEAVARLYRRKLSKSPLLDGTFEATDFFPHLGDGGMWLQCTASTLKDFEGNIIGAIEAIEDITDKRHADQALWEYSKALEESNKELESFAYVASHDLQEPLRMVDGFLKLLARRYKGKLGPDADEFIAFAVNGAERMQALINDLLSYARITTRGKNFAPTNCNAIFASVISDLQFAIEESGATVKCAHLPTVMADQSQLRQAFLNLISNAIKFRSANHPCTIDISAEKSGGVWIFTIRDNGIGIEPSSQKRIFEIFQRVHGRDDYPGTGIGLAVCKKIVARHAGQIWIDSQPGVGTTFYFTIPECNDPD